MYNQKFAVAIKANSKVLREDGEKVYIPFGSEFSILLKNLNSVRALASVSIDGESVTEGVELIVPANGDVELERYFKNGNLQSGNRFKFIERTSSIEEYRGVGIEDGLIRVEFKFEKVYQTYVNPIYPMSWNGVPDYNNRFSPNAGENILRSATKSSTKNSGISSDTYGANSVRSQFTYDCAPADNVVSNVGYVNENGITVPGSVSNQQFVQGSWFQTEAHTHVIVLKLVGDVGQRQVKEPVYVSTKQKCVTCGRNNKSNAKFCSNCGTSLQIV